MFSKHDSATTTFPSTWKTEQELISGGTQTDDQQKKDVESQVIETEQASTQTEEEKIAEVQNPEYNESSLLSFLQKIIPQVEKEIEKSKRSRAFASYSDLDENINTEMKCLHTLRCSHMTSQHVVTDIQWSCTGSVVAVAYGEELHDDWCKHKGGVAVWNINRHDFAANAPEQVMETSTCVSCLAFHPNNPAILAAGSITGEVTVYDLSKTKEANSYIPGLTGGASVARLAWIPSLGGEPHKSGFSLVSATTEGAILAWDLVPTKETINLKTGFFVSHDDVPRESRSRFGTGNIGVGFTSITFGAHDSSSFILGTEGGAVLLCSTSLKEKSGSSVGNVDLLKCMTSSLAPHTGRVLQTLFSPHHRHAVHTLGSDNTLRLYSLMQTNRPVSVVYSEEAVTCSEWSSSRPLVVAVGKVDGDVVFYSFENKNCQPVITIPAAEKPSPISCLAFNKNNLKVLAIGDQLGRVFIWQLPDAVVSPAPTEQASLDSLVKVTDE